MLSKKLSFMPHSLVTEMKESPNLSFIIYIPLCSYVFTKYSL